MRSRKASRDLHEHQIGTVSGMEQALRHLLDSLAPAAVEAAAGSGGLGGMLPGGRKARLWDAYVALHRRMTENASDNIREVFGTSFAEGYDKQKDRVLNRRNREPAAGPADCRHDVASESCAC